VSEERFKEIFRRLTSETPDPPAFSDLETHRAKPAAPIRLKPWMAAVGAAALVLVVVGAFGLLGGGGPDLAAPDESTIDYIKLEYSSSVNLVCEGGELVDNGGFDEATIEIWGPNSDDLTLMVVMFPDGSTERMIVEGDHLQPAHAWSTVPNTPFVLDGQSRFRTAHCKLGDSLVGGIAPPYSASGMLPLTYLGIPTEPGWWVEGLESGHVTNDEYQGNKALKILVETDTEHSSLVNAAYFDKGDPMQFLASLEIGESPTLGTWRMEVAWVESGSVPESSVSFSTDDFPYQTEGEPNPVTTTTVPPDSCPVTIPGQGFTPPADYPATPSDPNSVWHGDDQLWTVLSTDGSYVPRKSVWWSVNFPGGAAENEPPIQTTYRLLNTNRDLTFRSEEGTNAYTEADGWFMIANIDPNYSGCWEVTATYKGASLTYVYYNPDGLDSSTLGIVPDVVGMTVERAVNVLLDAGYGGSPHDSEDPTYEVCAQEPGAGLEINPGAIIGLRTAPLGGCDELMDTSTGERCLDYQYLPPPDDLVGVVFFNCGDGESPNLRPVDRTFPDREADAPIFSRIMDVMEHLVAGPTTAERADGFSSFFSEESAGSLLTASFQDGNMIVDFTEDITVDNASTSNGSTFFLGELYANAFQFEDVESVEFQINGSCEAFWEFLQAGECNITDRATWEQIQSQWENG